MTDIMLTNKTTTKAEGAHNSGHCRPFHCIEEAKTFTSIIDGANFLGVSYNALWNHLHGKARSCKGKHCFFLDERDEHFEAMSTHVSEMHKRQSELERKAALWDAYEAEQAAIRKVEEEYQKAHDKANAKLERRRRVLANAEARVAAARKRVHEAMEEIYALDSEYEEAHKGTEGKERINANVCTMA